MFIVFITDGITEMIPTTEIKYISIQENIKITVRTKKGIYMTKEIQFHEEEDKWLISCMPNEIEERKQEFINAINVLKETVSAAKADKH